MNIREKPELYPLSLKQNFSWTFVGNIIYAACQWGMLVVLAKLGNPEMVGQFALGLAICAPVIMFTNLQLRVVQATDAKSEYAFGDYLGFRLATSLLSLIIIAGIVIILGYRWEVALVILCVGLAKSFESVSDIIFGLLQKHERMDRVGISKGIKGPLSLLALGGLIWITGNIVYGILAMALSWLFLLLIYDLPNANLFSLLQPRLQKNIFWRLLRLTLPLGLVMMLISINTNIPIYFLKHHWGEKELGYYSAMAYLMVAGNLIVSALGMTATPRLAKDYASGNDSAFAKLLLRLVFLGLGLGIVGMSIATIFGEYLLILFYQKDYAQYANVLVWLMAAAGIRYMASFLGYGMSSARYFRVQMPLFTVVAISTALASLILVPRYGILGGAQAVVVSALMNMLGSSAVIVHAYFSVSKHSSRFQEIDFDA